MFGPGAFRLFLAFCVCVAHLSRFNIGETAVCVFFILSGYWVVRMYREKYLELPYPRTTFWIARFLRIWILYAFCVVAFMAIFAWGFDRYQPERWYGLLLFGTATHGNDILGVSWSLDIEVQFYLVVPLVAAILVWSVPKAGALAVFVASAILSLPGWYLVDQVDLNILPAYLVLFVGGALVYLAPIGSSRLAAGLSVLAFVAVGIGVFLHPQLGVLFDGTKENPFHDRWFAVTWALFLIPFIAWNVKQKSNGFDRHMGNISYSVYLIHNPFYLGAAATFDNLSRLEKGGLLLLTIPVALIPYLLVDLPVERHRERLSRAFAEWLHRFRFGSSARLAHSSLKDSSENTIPGQAKIR